MTSNLKRLYMRCTKPLQNLEKIYEFLVKLVTSVEIICPSAICVDNIVVTDLMEIEQSSVPYSVSVLMPIL